MLLNDFNERLSHKKRFKLNIDKIKFIINKNID